MDTPSKGNPRSMYEGKLKRTPLSWRSFNHWNNKLRFTCSPSFGASGTQSTRPCNCWNGVSSQYTNGKYESWFVTRRTLYSPSIIEREDRNYQRIAKHPDPFTKIKHLQLPESTWQMMKPQEEEISIMSLSSSVCIDANCFFELLVGLTGLTTIPWVKKAARFTQDEQ